MLALRVSCSSRIAQSHIDEHLMTEISNVILAAVLLFSVSCGPRPNALKSGNDPGPSQADARAEIKGRWEQSCKSLDQKQLGTQYPGSKLDLLIKVLEQTQAPQIEAERERIRRDPTDYQQLEEYDRYLLQALYVMSANAKDRAGLIYLFSGKCPRFIANSAIELEVASLEIPQPLLILFDSYSKASNGERAYLLEVLRHAFKALSKKYPDDKAFIDASRAWYVENESKIMPNPYYHPFVDSVEQRDLFVSKP
jgi:hypothetical protein